MGLNQKKLLGKLEITWVAAKERDLFATPSAYLPDSP